jgi:hypothetical protein
MISTFDIEEFPRFACLPPTREAFGAPFLPRSGGNIHGEAVKKRCPVEATPG